MVVRDQHPDPPTHPPPPSPLLPSPARPSRRCVVPARAADARGAPATPPAAGAGGASPSITALSSACAWPPRAATLSISAIARPGSRRTSTSAARALALMLNSFCDTASCSSRASRARSSRTESSRPRSYSRALVSAMAACDANRASSCSSRSVKLFAGRAARRGVAGREDDAENVVAVPDRDAQEVGHIRVGLRPALEPGIGADIVDPHRLSLAQQHAEHAMLPRQRADRLALAFRYAVDDELGERPVVVGHAERRVPGTDEGAGRPDDHLQHVAGRQLPGHGEHHLAHPLQHVVLAAGRPPAAPAVPGAVTTAPQPRIAHTSHATGVLARPDRPPVLGP